ncbi:hypothetical protein D3C75_1238050 [compost metagenome]
MASGFLALAEMASVAATLPYESMPLLPSGPVSPGNMGSHWAPGTISFIFSCCTSCCGAMDHQAVK